MRATYREFHSSFVSEMSQGGRVAKLFVCKDRGIMETMRSTRTDERLDDLAHCVDTGFACLEERFDALQRTLIQMGGAMIVALIGLIATQL